MTSATLTRQSGLHSRNRIQHPYLHRQAAQLCEVAERPSPRRAAQLAGPREARAGSRGGAHVPEPVPAFLRDRLALGKYPTLRSL